MGRIVTSEKGGSPGPAFHVSGITAALLYGTVSSSMTFCNKALSQEYGFNYPLFLLMIQMTTTQIGLIFMHYMGLFRYPRMTSQGLKEHLLVTCMYCLNAVLALASLQATSIPTYGVLKRAGPLYILIISAVASRMNGPERKAKEERDEAAAASDVEMGSREEHQGSTAVENHAEKSNGSAQNHPTAAADYPEAKKPGEGGPGVVAGVVIIVGGTLLTGWNDVHLTAAALYLATSSSVVQSVYVLLVEGKHKSGGVGARYEYGQGVDPTLGLLAHNSLLSVPLLIVIIGLLDVLEFKDTTGFMNPALYSQGLVGTIALATLLGCSLNYTMFLCIRANSALTTSLVGHAKTAVQTCLGFFVLALDVQASSQYVLGVVLNAAGGLLFTMAKHKQKQNVALLGPWGWAWWWERLLPGGTGQKPVRATLTAAMKL